MRIPEELIGAEPKVPCACPGSEVRGRPIEIGLRLESFEKTRAGLCLGLERFGKSLGIHQYLAEIDLKAAGSADNEQPSDARCFNGGN